jgi:large subunit ribosomal protein L22
MSNIVDYKKDIISKAILNNGKISPRKISLMVDEIRNKTVIESKKILSFSKKKAADMLLKLLESAIGNAVNNNHYDKDKVKKLVISDIWVGKGMVLKRTEPRARGSGNRLLKRYSNVYMYLKEKSLMAEVTTKKNKRNIKAGENK